jgi:hypothetical protein
MVSRVIQRKSSNDSLLYAMTPTLLFSQAVSMLGAVEFQQEKWEGSDQEFTLRLCKSILQRLTKMFESFIVSNLSLRYSPKR